MHVRTGARQQRVINHGQPMLTGVAPALGFARAFVLALLGVITLLGLTGTVIVGGGVARAQDDGGSKGSTTGQYSLTVHKFDGDPAWQTMGPTAAEPEPLAGITFQINKLEGLDVNDQAELGNLVQRDPRLLTEQSTYPLGPEQTAVTAADGKARFSDLTRGVYLVREEPSRVGNTNYSVIAPFLVAVPDAAGNPNVVVRAKNQPIVATKNIISGVPGTPEANRIAEEHKNGIVRYRLETTLPAPDVRGKLYQLIMADPLDRNLEFKGVTDGLIVNGEKTIHLREGDDFRVELQGAPQASDYGYADKIVKIILTENGLIKAAEMRNGHPETRVAFDIQTAVKANTPEGTRIKNVTLSFPDGHPYWPHLLPGSSESLVESNEVEFVVGPSASVPADPEGQLPVNPGKWPDWIFSPIYPLPPGGHNHPVPGSRPQCTNCVPGSTTAPAGAHGGPTQGIRPGEVPSRGGLPGLIDRLPMTGANVLGLLGAGFALVLVGFFVVVGRRRRKDNSDAHMHPTSTPTRRREVSGDE
ncbi:SpaH/EbpB family LPXTG-anchored major pilin [Corynebacterium auriscanis]|uniref:SpaH/EbpB family LPXTG-anchored major pilin n=1 Tax=Corynebacterium auriscanis TaxID=99807 RepID=UPI003CF4A0A4